MDVRLTDGHVCKNYLHPRHVYMLGWYGFTKMSENDNQKIGDLVTEKDA